RQSRRVSHQPRHTSMARMLPHHRIGVPMASTSAAYPLAHGPCPGVGQLQQYETGRLIVSQVHGSDWYGWCFCRPVLKDSIALLYSNSEISGEITGMFVPCSSAQCRSYPLLVASQPVQVAR